MKLYLLVIGIAMGAICAINIALHTAPWYYILIAVIFCTLMQFVLDGSLAIIINKMPNRWFGVEKKAYRVSKKERELYKKMNVRAWKDKVWELGWLGGFSKKELKEPNNPDYIERFIVECNKGVLTHRLSYPAGFLVMLLLPNICAFTVALPVAVVNLFLNILPTVVLRYNTPPLMSVLKRLRRKQNMETIPF